MSAVDQFGPGHDLAPPLTSAMIDRTDRSPPMPLHPDSLKVHALYAAAKRPPLEQQTPAEAREGMSRSRPHLQPEPPRIAAVADRSIPGPAAPIPLRVYRPLQPASTLGALIYFHGGGWVIGDLNSHDTLCRTLCAESGHAVIAVDYRLAPEHRFPAAVEDAIAATRWIAANARDLAVDATRLAVGGDSAGGNLAAVVALAVRGEIALRHQLLIYPAVDARQRFPSVERHGDVLPLTKPAMAWFFAHYAGGADLSTDWRAAPLDAPDHRGLPPATVLLAEYDVLHDEGHTYADTLAAAGVAVERTVYPGMIHGFITMGKLVADANRATSDAAAALARHLA
jgi:acetyl esterase